MFHLGVLEYLIVGFTPYSVEAPADTVVVTSTLLLSLLLIAGLCLLPSDRFKLGSATLIRLIVPSWRFYEEVGEVPELLYREGPDPTSLGAWRRCLHPPKRGFVLNSRENLFLAARGAVGQLVCEASEWESGERPAFADTVAYRLVANLVRAHIPNQEGYFQFRVRPQLSSVPRQDYLLSGVHSL